MCKICWTLDFWYVFTTVVHNFKLRFHIFGKWCFYHNKQSGIMHLLLCYMILPNKREVLESSYKNCKNYTGFEKAFRFCHRNSLTTIFRPPEGKEPIFYLKSWFCFIYELKENEKHWKYALLFIGKTFQRYLLTFLGTSSINIW